MLGLERRASPDARPAKRRRRRLPRTGRVRERVGHGWRDQVLPGSGLATDKHRRDPTGAGRDPRDPTDRLAENRDGGASADQGRNGMHRCTLAPRACSGNHPAPPRVILRHRPATPSGGYLPPLSALPGVDARRPGGDASPLHGWSTPSAPRQPLQSRDPAGRGKRRRPRARACAGSQASDRRVVRTRHWFQPGPDSPRFIGRRADVTRRRLLGISRRRLVVSSRSRVHPGDTRLLALEADAPAIPLGGGLEGAGPSARREWRLYRLCARSSSRCSPR